MLRPVKFSRPFFLLPILLATVAAGCVTTPLGRSARLERYFKVRITDARSHLVSEWIAEGGVTRKREGYQFKAVQRLSAPPFMQRTEYPQGRNVYVVGVHIVVSPTDKPNWLREIDGF